MRILLPLLLSGSAFAATTVSGTLCSGQNAQVSLSRYGASGVLLSQAPVTTYTAGVFSVSLQPALDGSRYEAVITCSGGTSTRQYWLIPDVASATVAQVTVASPDISPLKGYYWDALNLVWASGAGGIQGGGPGGGSISSTTSVLKGSGTGNAVAATADVDFLTPATAASSYEAKNANIQTHIASTSNPHSTTAAQVGALPTSTVLAANTTATSNQFFTAYNSTTGAFTKAQPSFSNISGSPTITQLNGAFTGTCDSTTFHRADGQCAAPAGGAHTQNTDTGTTQTSFQIDSGNTGPRIKNNAGTLEARNSADNAYAAMRAASFESAAGTTFTATGTTGATPTTPSAGSATLYFDSTSKTAKVVDDAGALSTTVRTASSCNSTTGKMIGVNADGTPNCGTDQTSGTTVLTRTCTLNIGDPTAADSGKFKCQIPVASTITYISCHTDTGSVATVNVNKRASATPGTSGTNALTTALTCSSTQSTGTITSSAVTARDWLTLTMGAATSTPTILTVSVEYTVN